MRKNASENSKLSISSLSKQTIQADFTRKVINAITARASKPQAPYRTALNDVLSVAVDSEDFFEVTLLKSGIFSVKK